MKTSELLKMLRQSGCYLLRHGSNHDIWYSVKTGMQFAVPRHKDEMKDGTVKRIMKDAGIY